MEFPYDRKELEATIEDSLIQGIPKKIIADNLKISVEAVEYYSNHGELNKENSMVDHPNHYAQTRIECIDALEAMVEPYKDAIDVANSWQVVKYIWRHPFKENPIQDLKKAKFYLDRLIKYYEQKK